jgi:hypothetical protein
LVYRFKHERFRLLNRQGFLLPLNLLGFTVGRFQVHLPIFDLLGDVSIDRASLRRSPPLTGCLLGLPLSVRLGIKRLAA